MDEASKAERFVDGHAVAEHLGVSYSWVWKAAKRGDIPSVRVGRAWRFRLSVAELERRELAAAAS